MCEISRLIWRLFYLCTNERVRVFWYISFGKKSTIRFADYSIFLKTKAEMNYHPCKIFRSISRISLPAFAFEFSVEQASDRMIDFQV